LIDSIEQWSPLVTYHMRLISYGLDGWSNALNEKNENIKTWLGIERDVVEVGRGRCHKMRMKFKGGSRSNSGEQTEKSKQPTNLPV